MTHNPNNFLPKFCFSNLYFQKTRIRIIKIRGICCVRFLSLLIENRENSLSSPMQRKLEKFRTENTSRSFSLLLNSCLSRRKSTRRKCTERDRKEKRNQRIVQRRRGQVYGPPSPSTRSHHSLIAAARPELACYDVVAVARIVAKARPALWPFNWPR